MPSSSIDPKDDLKKKTAETASLYFKGVKGEKPFDLWRSFDRNLALDMSLFITGQVYAREKIPHRTRQLVTVAALTALGRTDELKLHIQAALNVGCDKEEVAEVIFQMMIYAGVPLVNQALAAFREVLRERGEWED